VLMNIRQDNPPGQSETVRERPRNPEIGVAYPLWAWVSSWFILVVRGPCVDCYVTGCVRVDTPKLVHVLLCREKWEEKVSLAQSLVVF
jgi:hypothetical protein